MARFFAFWAHGPSWLESVPDGPLPRTLYGPPWSHQEIWYFHDVPLTDVKRWHRVEWHRNSADGLFVYAPSHRRMTAVRDRIIARWPDRASMFREIAGQVFTGRRAIGADRVNRIQFDANGLPTGYAVQDGLVYWYPPMKWWAVFGIGMRALGIRVGSATLAGAMVGYRADRDRAYRFLAEHRLAIAALVRQQRSAANRVARQQRQPGIRPYHHCAVPSTPARRCRLRTGVWFD